MSRTMDGIVLAARMERMLAANTMLSIVSFATAMHASQHGLASSNMSCMVEGV